MYSFFFVDNPNISGNCWREFSRDRQPESVTWWEILATTLTAGLHHNTWCPKRLFSRAEALTWYETLGCESFCLLQGSFGPFGPKMEKESENEFLGPLAQGAGPKSRKWSRERVNIVEKQSILTLFRLPTPFSTFWALGPRGPRNSFSDFFFPLWARRAQMTLVAGPQIPKPYVAFSQPPSCFPPPLQVLSPLLAPLPLFTSPFIPPFFDSRKIGDGKAHKPFQHKLFGPQCPGKGRKEETHIINFFGGIFGAKQGVPNGPYSATKSLVYCFCPALTKLRTTSCVVSHLLSWTCHPRNAVRSPPRRAIEPVLVLFSEKSPCP